MKIEFADRTQFEKGFDIIVVDPNTRLNSAGDIDIGYADMIFT